MNRYVAELTNPELALWVLDNADAEDREPLALKLDNVAKAVAAIAE